VIGTHEESKPLARLDVDGTIILNGNKISREVDVNSRGHRQMEGSYEHDSEIWFHIILGIL
jgi:hypothetical protein